MRARLLLAFAAAAIVACPGSSDHEDCTNSLDDDGDGLVDCADSACASSPACPGGDGGFWGFCGRCGQGCDVQQECLASNWGVDDPLPICLDHRCQAFFEGVDLRVEVDTQSWTGVSTMIRSMNTRFVKKAALDGSAVTCEVLKAAAASKLAADADQLERSGRFNLQAYDVAAVSGAPGTILTQPFLSTATGGDFIIWLELWSGPRDSNSKLPTGFRMGYACVETGPAVEPIKTEHHWPSGTPTATSRTLSITMPTPQ